MYSFFLLSVFAKIPHDLHEKQLLLSSVFNIYSTVLPLTIHTVLVP